MGGPATGRPHGRVLMGLLPPRQAMAYRRIEPYGFMIVIALMYFNLLDRFIFYPIQIILQVLAVQPGQRFLMLLKQDGKVKNEKIVDVRFVPMVDERGKIY
jgi:hypothetical protein